MNNGFIKLPRSILRSSIWTEPRVFSRFEAFVDMLQLAVYTHTEKIVKGSVVALTPGQFCGSERYLAERWGWSTKKVRALLTLLEAAGKVTLEKKRGGSIITILNPDSYEDSGSAKDAPRKHPGSTEEANNKKGKKAEEGEGTPPPASAEAKPLCTLNQAIAYAPMCRMTAEEATHWWHSRNKAGWTISGAGGGFRKLTNWQSDMATAQPWVRKQMAEEKLSRGNGGAASKAKL